MKKLPKSREFDDTLLPWLGRIMKLADALITSKLIEHNIDLTRVQLILLKILNDYDGQPQNDLAIITNRDKASLARLLNTVERKGLVVRVHSKEDKRIKLVHITKKGIEQYESARPLLKEMIDTIQKGMSERDINMMIGKLKHVQQNIENCLFVA